MPDDVCSCPSCGARVSPGADACSLCGTPVEAAADASDETEEPSVPPDGREESPETNAAPDDAPAPETVFCNACGWENPSGANYCSQCGSELQDLTEAPDAPAGTKAVSADLPSGEAVPDAAPAAPTDDEEDEQAEMGRQVLLVVGTAVALVLGLFFVTQWSQQYEWGSTASSDGPGATAQAPAGSEGAPSTAAGPNAGGGRTPASPQAAATQPPADLSSLVGELSGPVEGPVADQIDSLEAAVEGAEGDRRRELQSQLVKLYIGGGAPGRAAQVQATLADQTGRVEDRQRAANLLYKWMRQVEQQQGRAEVSDVARHVAEAYAAVVEQRPEDLDARTRMGEAYLLTNSPMKGIQAINQVLEDDSTFVPARFQKGLALLQINRLNQAVAQFEQVMTHASQDDPFYQQAKRAIEVIREQAGSEGQESSGGQQSSTGR